MTVFTVLVILNYFYMSSFKRYVGLGGKPGERLNGCIDDLNGEARRASINYVRIRRRLGELKNFNLTLS